MTVVDTDVLLDIFTADKVFGQKKKGLSSTADWMRLLRGED